MAGKNIVFVCLLAVTLGSSIFDPDDCEETETQDFEITSCTIQTETVAKVHGRCPRDTTRKRRVCEPSETEICRTRHGITSCRTFPDRACVYSYTVITRMERNDDEGDTCETDKATCEDQTLQGTKKRKCSI